MIAFKKTEFKSIPFLGFLLLTLGMSSLQPALAQKVLIYSDHQPLEGMRTKFLKEIFFPAIEHESQGRLKIEAHWDGEIAIAYDALGAVSAGDKTDIATVVPEYTAAELPIHQLFKSFPVGPSGAKQVSFFRNVFAHVPQFDQELDKNNIVQIFLGTGYPVGFYSRDPMTGLNGLKDGRWRSASFWHLDFLKNVGAIPVRMHWGQEVYDALADGTLDGIMVNVDSGYNLRLYEHAPHLLMSKNLWLGHLYMVAINKETWNSLEKRDQDAIKRAAFYSYKLLGKRMDMSYNEQIDELKELGTTVRELSRQEVNAFKEATDYEAIQDAWVSEQEAAGVEGITEALQKLRVILNRSMK